MKGTPELEPREESLPASAIEAKTHCRRQPGTSYVNACFPTVWSIQDCTVVGPQPAAGEGRACFSPCDDERPGVFGGAALCLLSGKDVAKA